MRLIMVLLVILIYFIPDVELKKNVINIISASWFIFTVIYFLIVYFKKDKEHRNELKSRYYKYIPNNRSPETLGFILDGYVKKEHLLATLKELMRKKVILVGKFKDSTEYVLVNKKSTSMFLSESESFLVKWFFENIGNGEYVTFEQIKKESKNNRGYFNSCYRDYVELVNFECAKCSFFESKKALLDNIFFYFFISYIFFVYNHFVINNPINGTIIFIITTGLLIYVNTFFKRTIEISREYYEWIAFKRWIKEDINATKDYNIEEFEMCIVYAKLLKVDNYIKKAVSSRKDVIKSNLVSCYKMGIIDELDLILDRGIKNSNLATILLGRNRGISTSRKLKNDKEIKIIYERKS